MKVCKNCGQQFQPKNPKGKFCSDKCRVYYGRLKKKTILSVGGGNIGIIPTINENKDKIEPYKSATEIPAFLKIKEYEDQIKSIQDLGVKTLLAQKTIRFCQNKIYELKSKLNQ